MGHLEASDPGTLKWYNKYFGPEADKMIASEARERLKEIKRALGEVLVTRNVWHGTGKVVRALWVYLDLQYPLPVEERVTLIKLVYEIMMVDLTNTHVQLRAAQVLQVLFRKEIDLPGLVMPWRPFFDLLKSLYFVRDRATLPGAPDGHAGTIISVVRKARRYFAPEATEEMLKEFRPMLSPHDMVTFEGQALMVTFLPTRNVPVKTIQTWLPEVFVYWPWMLDTPDWDMQWLRLLARVAYDTVGRFDWSPYLDALFTAFVKTIDVPVGTGRGRGPRRNSIPTVSQFFLPGGSRDATTMGAIADIIVSMMGPKGPPKLMEHVSNLMRTLEPYFHPSNTGSWTGTLAVLLSKLASAATERRGWEINGTTYPVCKTPKEARLRQEDVLALVKILDPYVRLALWAKSPRMAYSGAQALRHSAFLAPQAILPVTLDRIYLALQTVTEPHQALAAIHMLSDLVVPLFRHGHFPPGQAHLAPLLEATLPGIDLNDPLKTGSTLEFYRAVFYNIPLIDATNAPGADKVNIVDDIEDQTREGTARIQDWFLAFLERLFVLLDNVEEAKSTDKGTGAAIRAGVAGIIRETLQVGFIQMGDTMYKAAIKKLSDLVLSSVRPNAIKEIALIVGGATSSNPAAALKAFLPRLKAEILTELAEVAATPVLPPGTAPPKPSSAGTAAQTASGQMPPVLETRLVWYIRILAQMMRHAGPESRHHVPLVTEILDKALYVTGSREVGKMAGKLLRYTLAGLTRPTNKEMRSVPPSVWNKPDFAATHWRYWGKTWDRETQLEVAFHVPTKADIAAANNLLRRYVLPAAATAWAAAAKGAASSGPVKPTSSTRVTSSSRGASSHRAKTASPPPPAPPSSVRKSPAPPSAPMSLGDKGKTSNGPFYKPMAVPPLPAGWAGSVDKVVSATGNSIDKTVLWNMLMVVRNGLRGVSGYLPEIDPKENPILDRADSQDARLWRESVPAPPYVPLKIQSSDDPSTDIPSLRLNLGQLLHVLTRHFAIARADDTNLLKLLAKIMYPYLGHRGDRSSKYTQNKRGYQTRKAMSRDLTGPRKAHPRIMHLVRVNLQLSLRRMEASNTIPFHQIYADLLDDLAMLSTFEYSVVRRKAQGFLQAVMSVFPLGARRVLPRMISILSQPDAKDSAVTGAVYSLSSRYALGRITRSWTFTAQFMEAICNSDMHDAVTVQARLRQLFNSFQHYFRTRPLETPVYDGVFAKTFKDLVPPADVDSGVIKVAKKYVTDTNARLHKTYDTTFASMFAQLTDEKKERHWQYRSMLAACVAMLLRDDIKPKLEVLPWFLGGMVSDVQEIRGISAESVRFLLAAFKPIHPRKMVTDPKEYPGGASWKRLGWKDMMKIVPQGTTGTAYDSSLFMDRNYWGFNARATSYKKYAPLGTPKVERWTAAEKEAAKKVLEKKEWWERWLGFEANETRKGYESFRHATGQMFKGFMQTFGADLLPYIEKPIGELIDKTEERGHQAVAAEILGGLGRGTKHFPHAKAAPVWEWLWKYIEKGCADSSPESQADWAAAIRFVGFDRDIRRVEWLMSRLLAKVVSVPTPDETSFARSKKLVFLSPLLGEHSWRDPRSNLAALKALTPLLAYEYKQVRVQIGSVLGTVFRNLSDPLRAPTGVPVPGLAPRVPELDAFVRVAVKRLEESAAYFAKAGHRKEVKDPVSDAHSAGRKTIVMWLMLMYSTGNGAIALPYLTELLPGLLDVNDDREPELAAELRQCLYLLSFSDITVEVLGPVLDVLFKSARSKNWHVRHSVLPVLQVIVFRHLFQLEAAKTDLSKVYDLLAELMSDPVFEIRDLASVSLSGLLRTATESGFNSLAKKFARLGKTAVVKGDTEEAGATLRKRHGGVLGLAAIVMAHPYDVPSYIPGVVMALAGHIGDPSPIKETVRKTLRDWRRTHQDEWMRHMEQFSDDDRATLTELTVSASYYA